MNDKNGFLAVGLVLGLMLLICVPLSAIWCWALGFTLHYGTIFVSVFTTLFILLFIKAYAHEPLDNLPPVTKEDEEQAREEDEPKE